VTGYLYSDSDRLIITDGYGEIVAWQIEGLPFPMDAARERVEGFLQRLREEDEGLAFKAPVGEASALYYDGGNVVITDDRNSVLAWRGPALPASTDATDAARKGVEDFLEEIEGAVLPLIFEIPAWNYIHYGDSKLVNRISLATFIQIGALLLFLLVGYIGFRNIKRSEQRFIWVGTAKETAHQLGTPLSSLSGWLELLEHEIGTCRSASAPSPDSLERIRGMVDEMQEDMRRLAQIASRFSQIGSVPELRMGDVVALLEETIAYFHDRRPQFGQHEIRLQVRGEVPLIPLNADLLSWGFENLFKNAIDAIEQPAGKIEVFVEVPSDRRSVQIAFRDDGRGIESGYLGRIFDPGFSTKKRGWGLGLAFAKRIIEEYHGGRLSVVQSAPGEGTTLAVVLPASRSGH
jgi:signal transduction histidine kinase